MQVYLEFEKPVADIDGKIRELIDLSEGDESVDLNSEIERLRGKSREALNDLYSKLTPWHKTMVARHPDRPHFVDYAKALFTEFSPLSGDRHFGDDLAVQAGFARYKGQPVALIGQEKGFDTQTRLAHNFGMARPEGYRKAVRIMELADRFDLPVITLVDTAGAYPGIGAEERGQAEAIARSTDCSLGLGVPMISVIVGEGGSGGAIAIAASNRVYMLEHSIYSVASPEAVASILWRDATRAKDVAAAMKITAQDLKKMGIIDDIINEPVGGAHRDHEAIFQETADMLDIGLTELVGKSGDELRQQRRDKFLQIGRDLG